MLGRTACKAAGEISTAVPLPPPGRLSASGTMMASATSPAASHLRGMFMIRPSTL